MSTEEFEREFDILYNNIMSNAAPSIDAYEKSVFLTKAQEEIVTAIYDGSFEHTEKSTEYLDVLVVTENLDSANSLDAKKPELNSLKIAANSKLFKLSNEAMFIVYEALKMKNKDACGHEITIPVKPTKHDEYHRIARNPFRRARWREALRLNISSAEEKDILEIISLSAEYIYQVRYVRKPRPIVIYSEPGLTIEGVDTVTNCELPSMLHRAILDRAVQMAVAVYKQPS